ncbi:MAG: hypothetical protein ABUL77_03975, partial [Bacteroidota bacterium]
MTGQGAMRGTSKGWGLGPRAWWAAGLFALAACTYDPHPQEGKLRCSVNGECPTGYTCRRGLGTCWSAGSTDPDAGVDGGRDLASKDAPAVDRISATGGAVTGGRGTGGAATGGAATGGAATGGAATGGRGTGGAGTGGAGTGGRGTGGAGGVSACVDTCRFHTDGICDEPFDCAIGTDCTDCYSTLCINTCRYQRDGVCDELQDCALGTDCA